MIGGGSASPFSLQEENVDENSKTDTIERALMLLKLDLGLSSTARDEYFKTLIGACQSELEKKFRLDLTDLEDMILLTDFSVWRYRSRISGDPMPENLKFRIRNRSARGRVKDGKIS